MNVQVGLVAAEASSGSTLLHDLAAEQQLLGACLVWPDAVDLAVSILEPEHFFEPVHAQIFEWLRDMRSRGQRTSMPLLNAQLGRLGHVDILGLPLSVFVSRLCREATTGVNVPDFAKVVRDWWERRQMQAVLQSGLELIKFAPIQVLPAEIRNETIEQLDAISSNQIPQTIRAVTIGDAAREAMTNLSDAIQRNGQLAGITFGLSDLDRRTSGIPRSELSILAGRPGMGKTAVGVHVALKAAESGAHVLYCSLEMMAAALAQRALTALAFKLSGNHRGIPYSDLRSGRGITDDDFRLLRDAQDYLHSLPLVIEQQPSLTLAQIAMRARRLKQKYGLDLLILDHIHRVQPGNRYRGDPTAEISEISSGCAALAKELNIAFLGLCQLSRATETRDNKRPQLSDLRQSGSLEQDADLVLLAFREAYYQQQPEATDCLELRIAKQRQGPTDTLKFFCAIESNVISGLALDTRLEVAT
jgi:replicative DNA helicase